MPTALPQYLSPVPTITILEVHCPTQEPCVAGQSAPLCGSCIHFVTDALNASELGLDDFVAATLLRITSIRTQMLHQSPLPSPVSQVPNSPDANTLEILSEETGSSSAVHMPDSITVSRPRLTEEKKGRIRRYFAIGCPTEQLLLCVIVPPHRFIGFSMAVVSQCQRIRSDGLGR